MDNVSKIYQVYKRKSFLYDVIFLSKLNGQGRSVGEANVNVSPEKVHVKIEK